MKPVFVIMGVSGCGKTTVGKLLAEKLQLPFYDADDFHPRANIEKMSKGKPLTDADRKPWLEILSREIRHWAEGKGAVLACSALKESYRKSLATHIEIRWIVLHGAFDIILDRMQKRPEHFMGAEMLRSQFDDLELPTYGLHLDIEKRPIALVSEILKDSLTSKRSTLGIVGLGVMGRSLAHNVLSRGISVSVYNRAEGNEANVVSNFLAKADTPLAHGFTEYEAFVRSLKTPRKILLMIPAGPVVDTVLLGIQPYLTSGDILIDGGNSHFEDTRRRVEYFKQIEIDFIGCGVSGGEEGALKGPSLMAGGTNEAYSKIRPVLEAIAARDKNGKPCAALAGTDGAGHFVKMVHNGIEYAEMQLLAEIYALLRPTMNYASIANLLSEWNQVELSSYLLEITIDILRYKEGDGYLLDSILDKASNKGTGGWSSKAAIDLGIPATMMSTSLFARYISSMKPIREELGRENTENVEIDLNQLDQAYQFARIVNHLQGFELIRQAAETYNWNTDLAEIARIWTNGCIIKSELMGSFQQYLTAKVSLFTKPEISSELKQKEASIKNVLTAGLEAAIALPCFSAALQFWYGMTTKDLPANLIQAQRDYFGGHTYMRTDKEGNHSTNWKTNG
ncbi:MAG: NADP-dependent phosphogluconate dehydrogenase [Flavobacterium sp.]|nr:MAG: NADP-dependent phosphogluconate dehydrogenase [Flavobacterium sp.]